MSVSRWLIAVSATALSVPFVHVSCVQIDCGEGTIERDGTCVPADSQPGSANCGEGTHLVGQDCVPDLVPTECDPDTTTAIPDPETGVITCVGSGVQGCGPPLACPPPDGNKLSLCGQLYDLETSAKLEAPGGGTGTACPADAASGPCALQINFYDAIDFVTDPVGTQPVPIGNLYVDDCGRFKAVNIPYPGSSFLGMGVDDKTGDDFALSGVALGPAQGSTTSNFEAFVMSQATNTAWSGMLATELGGQTIEEKGAYVTIFRLGAAPAQGVTFTNASGGSYPNDDVYFSDTDPTTRSSLEPAQTATGANGTSILLNRTGLAQYTGMGGIPDNCSFPTAMGAVIPHVIAAQVRPAIVDGSNPPALCTGP